MPSDSTHTRHDARVHRCQIGVAIVVSHPRGGPDGVCVGLARGHFKTSPVQRLGRQVVQIRERDQREIRSV